MAPLPSLSSDEMQLLQWVRQADEEIGGLWEGDIDASQREAMLRLVELELVERIGSAGSFEEHGDDDVDDGGAFRVTARGVEVLRESGNT